MRGGRYHATPSDLADDQRETTGFACLGVTLPEEQTYQYDYRVGPDRRSFEAIARDDLDGDGPSATFVVRGSVGPDGAPQVSTVDELPPAVPSYR